jgi:hypothetical protein
MWHHASMVHLAFARAGTGRAAGRGGLLARKFNLRQAAACQHSDILPLHEYTRLEGPHPTISGLLRSDAGWFWHSISKELSVEYFPKALYRRLANGSPDGRSTHDLRYADCRELMREAGASGLCALKGFSYGASTYAGDRWILAETQDRFSISFSTVSIAESD